MKFLKLGSISSLPTYTSDNSLIKFGEVLNGTFYGIEYHRAHIDITSEIDAILPAWALSSLVPTAMTINRKVPPHIDNGISFAVNIYLETSNCLTQFYEIAGEESSFQIKNQTDGRILNYDCLQPSESFIAEQGDIYILDVSCPHSVEPLEPGADVHRKALCYQGRNIPFSAMVEHLVVGPDGQVSSSFVPGGSLL